MLCVQYPDHPAWDDIRPANVTSVRKHVVPPNHLMLATAGGERSGLWSKDEGLVDRVAAAITDAFVHRG